MDELSAISQGDTAGVIGVRGIVGVDTHRLHREPTVVAFWTLLLFMFVYCARPEDWVPGLSKVPLAKITGTLAFLALLPSLRQFCMSVPREVRYLILLIVQLFLASIFSSIYRYGALKTTIDFAKVLVIIVLIASVVDTRKRLQSLIFIQVISVAVIAVVAAFKGRLLAGRLEGILGYSNPNELAVMITISLPLCVALLFMIHSRICKAIWISAMVVMVYVLILTGSRAGFLSITVAAAFFLWGVAIRGRRHYLLIIAALISMILLQSSSTKLMGRLRGTFDPKEDSAYAYGSAQQRRQLFWRSIEVTEEHPIFGVGPGNFAVLSGNWHVTHNSFTEFSSEGGLPALILYGLILWRGFKNTKAAKRLAQRAGESLVLPWALTASLAGYVVGSLFASAAYQFFPYFLVAYTTALFRIAKQSAIKSKEAELIAQASR
jgi:O-antigen ligase